VLPPPPRGTRAARLPYPARISRVAMGRCLSRRRLSRTRLHDCCWHGTQALTRGCAFTILNLNAPHLPRLAIHRRYLGRRNAPVRLYPTTLTTTLFSGSNRSWWAYIGTNAFHGRSSHERCTQSYALPPTACLYRSLHRHCRARHTTCRDLP